MTTIKTYQDLLEVGGDEKRRKDFVYELINEHKSSADYKIAKDAYEYFSHRNTTIREFQKLLYTVTGEVVPDNYSANFKMGCRHFYRFVTQEVQYLLGNGVSWNEESTEGLLGTKKKSFDRQLVDAAKKALWGKVAFGFYNNDHVDVFDYLEFAPLYDELDGSLKAGVRYWQIDSTKPMMATLYEIDGYTKYVYNLKRDADKANKDNSADLDVPKKAYIQHIVHTEADGDEVYDEENYPTFPIIPLWANSEHQSLLVGLREQIDCYDLIKSGFANTVDEASIVYWTIQNAGGMDDVDLAKFIKHIKTVHAAVMEDDGARAESHSQDVPFASRQALLECLDEDMYRDAMALDTQKISDGAVTATQIKAAYENLNAKCDDFEYQVLDFINGILDVAGINDEATFTRSMVVNQSEMVTTIIQSAPYLSEDYVTSKILEILGDGDKAEDVLKDIDSEAMSRTMFSKANEPVEKEEEQEPQEVQ